MLVEGLFDVHHLRSHGIENVAALGGTGVRGETFERLSRLGFERVTICLDRDDPGRAATTRAVERATRASASPAILVVDPAALAPAKDPDALVRERGAAAWYGLLQTSECGITWQALELLDGATPEADSTKRRSAIARAGSWLGRLPARFALEQEDAVRTVATRCGYSSEAVERAFRARYWERRDPDPPARHRSDRSNSLGIER